MFVLVEYGENETLLVNPDCPMKILTDYIQAKCKLEKDAIIDLSDENATLLDMYTKDPLENAFLLFQQRNTYLLCDIELNGDKTVKKITPLLKDWEKKYPFLERKLRHRDKKIKQEEEGRTGSGGKRQSLVSPLAVQKNSLSAKKSVGKKKKSTMDGRK